MQGCMWLEKDTGGYNGVTGGYNCLQGIITLTV